MSTTPQLDWQAELAKDIASFTHDPLGYAMYAFPWGKEGSDLEDAASPFSWQSGLLDSIGKHLRNPATRFKVFRKAVSSGHGIGKSSVLAMIVNWAMSTHEDTKVIITANTKGQLDTKTQPELKKWFRMAVNADWFEVQVSAIKSREADHEQTWRADLIPWSEDNPQAFAGAHNKGKRLLIIFDEASEISHVIYETIQGALTDANTEIIFLQFGNPTLNSGDFYEACFGNDTARWDPLIIDSREVEGTNKEELAEWARLFGEESDFFKVRVRGLPPSSADGQFIDKKRILDAQQREPHCLPDDPLICGVDAAWGGEDNNVIRFRRGKDAATYPAIKIRGEFTRDPSVLTNKLAELLDEGVLNPRTRQREELDFMFLDSAGIVGPVAARLREMGYTNIREVNFGADSPDPKFAYYRDYMWGKLKEWLLTGAIDKDPKLSGDLSAPTTVPDKQQRVRLVPKEQMKKILKRSTDDGDALALTFAAPVKIKSKPPKQRTRMMYPGQSSTGWMG